MSKSIVVIQGHRDPDGGHLCNALVDEYIRGAEHAGHRVELINVATLAFPLLRTKKEYESGTPPEAICQSQQLLRKANHIVIVYPLWAGTMPALCKGFLEQVFRPGFAMGPEQDSLPRKLLKGKRARIIVTMGMPVFLYRWYFRLHSLKNLERNILGFSGIRPIKTTLLGMVDNTTEDKRKAWLRTMTKLGAKAK